MLKDKDTRWKKSGEEKRVTVNCSLSTNCCWWFDIKPLALVIWEQVIIHWITSIQKNHYKIFYQFFATWNHCSCSDYLIVGVTKIGSICLWHGSVKCSKLDGNKTWYCHLDGNWVQMYGYRITICEQKQSIHRNYYKKILQQFVNRNVFIIISPLMTKGLSLPS